MTNELANVSGGALSRPEFLSEVAKEDYGTEVLQHYVSPPFVKVVQDNSKEPYNAYPSGTVLAVPLNVELFAPGQQFHITPILMYPEYVLTNPYPLKHLPFIRERSLDQKGELAMKCKDFANRMIVCPEAPADKQNDTKFMCTYFEHLNFMCLIWEHDIFRVNPIVFTFRSGEFKTGKKLSGLISMRNAPLAATRFAAWTGKHVVSGNENFGFNFDNPNPEVEGGMSPWLGLEEFEITQELHKKYRDLHTAGQIQVSYEDETAEKDATVDSPEM